MATQMSKSQLVEKIATTTELSKRDVKNVMDTLTDVGHKELKKSGVFLLPGWAKFVVVKKPATKDAFADVHGVGAEKLRKYGAVFLAAINGGADA